MRHPDPDQYDLFAADYGAHASISAHNALYDRPAVLDLAGEVEGLHVLDVGCGPGIYAAELLERGADVSACDSSPAMVEQARTRVGDRADVRVHSLEQPLDWVPDHSVDLVVSALVHHYITDRPGFLAEAHRVLRPAGALVLSTHHPAAEWHRLGGSYFAVETVTETWSRGWEVTSWRMPLTRLTTEFADAGFVIDRLIEPTPQAAMADSHPHEFERLSTGPAFVMFRLIKRD